VFGFLADFENVPKWNYAMVETRKVSGGSRRSRDDLPAGPLGSEAQPRELRGRRVRPPRHLEIRGQLGPFPSRLSYALEATPQGTRVTNAVELELRGPGRLLGRVAVPRVREAVAANLSKLKELLDR
jgi:hypothetical protein